MLLLLCFIIIINISWTQHVYMSDCFHAIVSYGLMLLSQSYDVVVTNWQVTYLTLWSCVVTGDFVWHCGFLITGSIIIISVLACYSNGLFLRYDSNGNV